MRVGVEPPISAAYIFCGEILKLWKTEGKMTSIYNWYSKLSSQLQHGEEWDLDGHGNFAHL